jgi:hypothetical protein
MQIIENKILELKSKLDRSQYVFSNFDRLINFFLPQRANLTIGRKPEYVNKKIVNGCTFIRSVLPFCDTSFAREDSIVGFVSAQNVLAGNYRGCSFPSDPQQLCDRLDSYAATGHMDAAEYVKIGPFNIYVVCEGKNRVDLYREIDRPIKAVISKTFYPKPHELELIRFIPFGGMGLRYIGPDLQAVRKVLEWKFVKTKRLGPVVVLGFEVYGVKIGGHAFSLRSKILAAKIRISVSEHFYVS